MRFAGVKKMRIHHRYETKKASNGVRSGAVPDDASSMASGD